MSNEETDVQDAELVEDGPGVDAGDASDSAFVIEEEKKPLSKGTVAMFLILSAAAVGTYFMYVRTGPSSASAAVNPQAQQVIKQFMSDKDKNLVTMQKMLRETESVVQQFLNYPSMTQVPLKDLKSNPFRVGSAEPGAPVANIDEAKEKKKREEERQAALRAVQGLQLQSVMVTGKRAACMINNTMYTEGQQIDAFTIEKIAPNAVVVRNDVYRFELRMQR
jgi:hypothetical protein